MASKWARVVWLEGSQEEEGVIPYNWVRGSSVFWPAVANAQRLHKRCAEPEVGKWRKFKLIKIKHMSDKMSDCEEYGATTTVEQSENEMPQKRQPKKKQREEFVYDNDVPNHDELQESHNGHELAIEVPKPPAKRSRKERDESSGSDLDVSISNNSSLSSSGGHHSSSKSHSHHRSSVTPSHGRHRSSVTPSHGCHRSSVSPSHGRHLSSVTPSHGHHRSSVTPSHGHHRPSVTQYHGRHRSSVTPSHGRHRSSVIPSHGHHRSSVTPSHGHHRPSVTPSHSHGSSGSRRSSTDSFPLTEERFQKRCLHLLLSIRDKLSRQESRELANSGDQLPEAVQLITTEDLKLFNEELMDKQRKYLWIQKCMQIGGGSVKDMVNNLTSRLLTNSLQRKLNMKGSRGEKTSFQKMELYKLIVESVVKSHGCT